MRHRVPPTAIGVLLGAALWAWCAAAAGAQQLPPRRIHYEGRLTTQWGAPIASAQTLWFALYAGGDALTTSSGTLRYRERATITPDAGGVFEHAIGDGSVEFGAIDPADFATTAPVFLQISVGSEQNAMLPRTRFSSVGYAFQAANATGDITPRSVSIDGFGPVIDNRGQWVGAPLPGLAGPQATAIEDVTGGRTVSGDLLRITGSGLAAARVTIGGREAPLQARSATEIVCQVPAGLAAGMQPVALAAGDGAALARVAGSIELTRYLVAVSTAGSAIEILDPRELDHDRTPVVAQITSLALGTHVGRIQPAFAHEGALLLLPDNRSGKLFAIDMTRNPPAPLDTAGFAVAQTSQTVAVDVSPAGDVLVVADHGGNRLRAVNITQSLPPYTTLAALLANETDAACQPPALPAGFAPRAVRFAGGGLLLALGDGTGQLIGYHRRLAAGAAEGERRRFFLDEAAAPDAVNTIPAGSGAFGLELTADRTRALVTRPGGLLACFDIAPMWMDLGSEAGRQATLGGSVMQAAIAPDGRTVLAAGCVAADSQSDDLLHVLALEGKDLRRFGAVAGPSNRAGNHFRLAAIEPVTGRTVAIATTDRSMYFYRLAGAALDRYDFEGPLVEGELMLGDAFQSIDTLEWQP